MGKLLEWLKANLAFYILIVLMAGSYFVPVYVAFYNTVSAWALLGLVPMALAMIWSRPLVGRDLFVHTLYSLGFGVMVAINIAYDPTRLDLLWVLVLPALILGVTRLFDGIE